MLPKLHTSLAADRTVPGAAPFRLREVRAEMSGISDRRRLRSVTPAATARTPATAMGTAARPSPRSIRSFSRGGWPSSGIVPLRSGFPFTFTQGGDHSTGGPERANRIPDGRLSRRSRSTEPRPGRRQNSPARLPYQIGAGTGPRPLTCGLGGSYTLLETRLVSR